MHVEIVNDLEDIPEIALAYARTELGIYYHNCGNYAKAV
jgi:hypothetical protein